MQYTSSNRWRTQRTGDMAGATGRVTDLATPPVLSTASLCSEAAVPEAVTTGVIDRLALVLEAAATGRLAGVGSEQALRVVEAVEAVKAWADSVAVGATAAMVRDFETDFVHLAPERPSARGWQLFFRHCRSAAAREIQVATGLPITQCQRRVWLTACEPERVRPVIEAMRQGRLTLVRAMALTEATAHLDAFTAAASAKPNAPTRTRSRGAESGLSPTPMAPGRC